MHLSATVIFHHSSCLDGRKCAKIACMFFGFRFQDFSTWWWQKSLQKTCLLYFHLSVTQISCGIPQGFIFGSLFSIHIYFTQLIQSHDVFHFCVDHTDICYVLLQSNNFSSVILTMNYMTTYINEKFICFIIAFLVFNLLTCICFTFLFLKHHCHVIISCNPSINQSRILGLSSVVKNPKVKYWHQIFWC